MIKSFSIENHYSINKKVEFSFKPNGDKYNPENVISENGLLKSLGIYGENGSGKSKVILAIRILINQLTSNRKYFPRPFMLFKSNMNDSRFNYVFEFQGKELIYNFSNTHKGEDGFGDETLHIGGELIYDRKDSSDLDTKMSGLRSAFHNDTLIKKYREVVETFFNYLEKIIIVDNMDNTVSNNVAAKLEKFYELSENRVKVNAFLNKSYDLFEMDFLEEELFKDIDIDYNKLNYDQKTIFNYSKDGNRNFILSTMESSGHRRLASFIPCLLDALNEDRLIIIDEIDTSFHFELIREIIGFFHESSSKAQMIFTTHMLDLMSTSIFRPDQLYLLKRNKEFETTLTRISDFPIRQGHNIQKLYKTGKLGNLPSFLDT